MGPAARARLRRPALVLLALNGAAFLAFTLPRTLQERNAAGRVAALREEVARERSRVAALRERADAMNANVRDGERFARERLRSRAEALLPALDEIHGAASAEGIRLGRESYAPEEATAGAPARVRVALPVSGSYEQIVGFLGRLERSKHFLVIDQLRLGAEAGSEAQLGIELSAYFQGPAGARDGGA